MNDMISIFVAADRAEADEVQEVLARAGLASRVELTESLGIGSLGAGPCRVLVAAAAHDDAIEALQAADESEDDEVDDGW